MAKLTSSSLSAVHNRKRQTTRRNIMVTRRAISRHIPNMVTLSVLPHLLTRHSTTLTRRFTRHVNRYREVVQHTRRATIFTSSFTRYPNHRHSRQGPTNRNFRSRRTRDLLVTDIRRHINANRRPHSLQHQTGLVSCTGIIQRLHQRQETSRRRIVAQTRTFRTVRRRQRIFLFQTATDRSRRPNIFDGSRLNTRTQVTNTKIRYLRVSTR